MGVKFLVDTAASTSFINEALVRRLGLTPRPHTTAVMGTLACAGESFGFLMVPFVTCPDSEYRAQAAEVHNITHERPADGSRPASQILMSSKTLARHLRKSKEYTMYRIDLETTQQALLNEIGAGFTPDETARFNAVLEKRSTIRNLVRQS
eukprot:jgi/Mesvir1/19903/Mv13178-RA.1